MSLRFASSDGHTTSLDADVLLKCLDEVSVFDKISEQNPMWAIEKISAIKEKIL